MLETINYVLWVIFCVTRPVLNKVLDVIYLVLVGRTKRLPPIRNRILLMSANQLAERIRKRKLTAKEVMEAYINRIKDVNPIVNACIDERYEDALKDACEVDRMLAAEDMTVEELRKRKPLLGVPFSCKEIIGVKGLAQTMGLKRFRDRKAPMDAETVSLYKKAGAIPVVVTNIPVVSMWWECSNPVFGTTLNPYDNRRTVGGSSGGEAAIITTAGALIGIGTDIGGSIRIPASFCGIYGHKSSRGLISNHRTTPTVNIKLDPFRTTGPMCRYVKDLPLLVKILSNENALKVKFEEQVDFSKVKIYYMEGLPGLLSATKEIKKSVQKAVEHFREEFGSFTEKFYLEELGHADQIWITKFKEADSSPFLPDIVNEKGDINCPLQLLKSLLKISDYDIPVLFFAMVMKRGKNKQYYKNLQRYADLEAKMEHILQGNSVLLLPTHPEPPPHTKTTVPRVKNTAYTSIFNTLGLPVTQIPAGLSNGLPIGIQAVAGMNNDHLTLATAIELDKVFGGWKCPTDIELE